MHSNSNTQKSNTYYLKNNPFLIAAKDGDLAIVRSLLEKDKNHLETTDILGQTALIIAAICGHAEVVEFLIGEGANLDAKTFAEIDESEEKYKPNSYQFWGRTALYYAIENHHSNIACLLIERGASVTLTKTDLQPIHLAIVKRDFPVLKKLVEACPHSIHINYGMNAFTGPLERNGKIAPLHCAALLNNKHDSDLNDQIEIINCLLAKGADVNAQIVQKNPDNKFLNLHGFTPLHCAVTEENAVAALVLIKAGSNLHLKAGPYEQLPIHYAAEKESMRGMVLKMLELDPHLVDETDKLGRTPLDIAAANNCKKIAAVIIMHEYEILGRPVRHFHEENGKLVFNEVVQEDQPKISNPPHQKTEKEIMEVTENNTTRKHTVFFTLGIDLHTPVSEIADSTLGLRQRKKSH